MPDEEYIAKVYADLCKLHDEAKNEKLRNAAGYIRAALMCMYAPDDEFWARSAKTWEHLL